MHSVSVAACDLLDRWIHPDAAEDARTASRHRALIATLLGLSLFGASAFPVRIAIGDGFGVLDGVFFSASATALLIAAYLARTGRMDHAVLMFAALVALLAVLLDLTGAGGPALALLALVAVEGSLAGSRRVLIGCLALAASGLALAFLTPAIAAASAAVEPLAVGVAGVMAVSTAARIALSHRDMRAAGDESERNYRVFADAVGGLVTRHDATGDAFFASPASRGLLGASPSDLKGGRFVRRIQVSDRVAFLNAMKECVRDRKDGTIRLRMLRARREGGRTTFASAPVEMTYRHLVDADTGEVSVVAVTREWVEMPRAVEAHGDAVSAFREPLNAIVEFSALLGRGMEVAANANAPDYAGLIRSSATRMLDLVNAGGDAGAGLPPGRPNGRFLSAATKSGDQRPRGGEPAAFQRNSGQSAQMKVFFPDFARGPGKSRQLRERTGG